MKKTTSFMVSGLCGIFIAAAAFNFWNGISGNGGFSGINLAVFFGTWLIAWALIHAGIKTFWRRRQAQITTMSSDESSKDN